MRPEQRRRRVELDGRVRGGEHPDPEGAAEGHRRAARATATASPPPPRARPRTASVAIGSARWRGRPPAGQPLEPATRPASAPPPIAPSSRPRPGGAGVEAVGDHRGELLDGRRERGEQRHADQQAADGRVARGVAERLAHPGRRAPRAPRPGRGASRSSTARPARGTTRRSGRSRPWRRTPPAPRRRSPGPSEAGDVDAGGVHAHRLRQPLARHQRGDEREHRRAGRARSPCPPGRSAGRCAQTWVPSTQVMTRQRGGGDGLEQERPDADGAAVEPVGERAGVAGEGDGRRPGHQREGARRRRGCRWPGGSASRWPRSAATSPRWTRGCASQTSRKSRWRRISGTGLTPPVSPQGG